MIFNFTVKSDLASVDINKKCFQDFSPLLTAAMAGFRFCVSALLSSKFLDLNAEWQGLKAETLAEQNGHKKVVQIIKVLSIFIFLKLQFYFYRKKENIEMNIQMSSLIIVH